VREYINGLDAQYLLHMHIPFFFKLKKITMEVELTKMSVKKGKW
jgi:hypothetical protein